MNQKLPNFLIVGAPKCGTTSIASYLSQHPQIYLSPIKEPKFFSAQIIQFPLRGPGDSFVENFTVKTFDEYQKLFLNAQAEMAIGEASVDNLFYYSKVIPLIKNQLGDVKIIVILRNPADRAFSSYKNMLRDSRETLTFEEGLQIEEYRKKMGYEYLWGYLETGFYYEQVKAYIESFSNVKVLILEHYEKNSLELFKTIYDFLGVDPGFKPKPSVQLNVSGRPRNRFIQRLFKPTAFKGKIYKMLAMRGIHLDRLMQFVERFRRNNIEPIHMDTGTRKYLNSVYQPDIRKLQRLLNVDLCTWIR